MSRARKPAVVDAALSEYWQQRITARCSFEIGLLIGQVGGVTDALLTAVRVPSESEDGAAARAFEDVSVDWVQEYAKQIDRLLPGGITIAGLYVVSPAPSRTVVDEATLYLRAVAESLGLPEAFAALTSDANVSSVHYVVHICPNSSKTSAKSFVDVVDASKTTSFPAELKTSAAGNIELREFAATVAVNEPIAFERELLEDASADNYAERVMHAVQTQLVPLATRVSSALAVAKRQDNERTASEVMQFLTSDVSEPRTREQTLAGSFCGAISCVAFILENETRATAIALLKRDFIKTLLLRAELVAEKHAADDDDDGEPRAVTLCGDVAFPARARLPWVSALGACRHFPALLHVFHGEHELAVQHAREMLGHDDDDDSSDATAASLTYLETAVGITSARSNAPAAASGAKTADSAAQTPADENGGGIALAVTSFVAAVAMAILAIYAQLQYEDED